LAYGSSSNSADLLLFLAGAGANKAAAPLCVGAAGVGVGVGVSVVGVADSGEEATVSLSPSDGVVDSALCGRNAKHEATSAQCKLEEY
jgi:hypothetical protein